jgi:hypothetical protein
MTSKNLADYGIYPRRSVVKQVAYVAKDEDCRQAAISVLLPEKYGVKGFSMRKTRKTSVGIAKGAGAGTVVGGALGWLLGVGFLAIPGVGPYIGTINPIMVVLVGASSGGLFGGIAGALLTMGIFQYEANLYAEGSKGGRVVVPVLTDEKEWKNISHRYTRG